MRRTTIGVAAVAVTALAVAAPALAADHTQNLAMTRGLTPNRLEEQRALVKRVNDKLAPFVVLHGTEMDILMDGQLDFSDEVLQSERYRAAGVAWLVPDGGSCSRSAGQVDVIVGTAR